MNSLTPTQSEPPRYQQVYKLLRDHLIAQRWAASQRLPAERDLAREVGVSRVTVARAIAQLVEEGYLQRTPRGGTYVRDDQAGRPGRRASALAQARTVAVLVPYGRASHSPFQFISTLLQAASEALTAQEARMAFYDSGASAAREADALRDILAHPPDALIALPLAPPQNQEIYAQLLHRDIPLVLVDRYFPRLDASYVVTDNFRGMYDLTNALIERGHKRIAFAMTNEQGVTALIDRQLGLQRAMLEACQPYSSHLARMFEPEASNDAAARAVASGHNRRIIQGWRRLRQPPTAIAAANEWVMLECLAALRAEGVPVVQGPADRSMELAGVFDNQALLAHIPEPMLCLVQPKTEIARQAVQIALEEAEQPDADGSHAVPRRIFLPPLVVQTPIQAND